MISKIPGLMPFRSGRYSKRRFTCSNMHVHAISKFIFSDLKESTNGVQAIESKMMSTSTIIVATMVPISPNCSPLMSALKASPKVLAELVPTGKTHLQNVTTTKARMMLLHAMPRWLNVITGKFWSLPTNLLCCFTTHFQGLVLPPILLTNAHMEVLQ
jgi:hypothetical protein